MAFLLLFSVKTCVIRIGFRRPIRGPGSKCASPMGIPNAGLAAGNTRLV